MTRFILIYGSIAGIFIASLLIGGIMIAGANGSAGSQLFGYLSMLVAMSIIFVAVKRYRDTQLGGVIKFWPALLLGAGIAELSLSSTLSPGRSISTQPAAPGLRPMSNRSAPSKQRKADQPRKSTPISRRPRT